MLTVNSPSLFVVVGEWIEIKLDMQNGAETTKDVTNYDLGGVYCNRWNGSHYLQHN